MTQDDKLAQKQRFEEAARASGCDETGGAFEKAFAKIVPPKFRPTPEPKRKEPDR